ncbi:DUF2911 domain-containing protein [Flavobacteriaceae bacterium]|jgi:hypothetical protein|nr:DUF2911 domain-containing protein [Flavobacteriaceae bacterium]MDB4496339.1 DUF2911 domain-containing protein [Flavobacteriaceae bacterium]MDC0652387.1 DUF2911 domain-containing protein [Flavobacteriaceae bacterium]MDC1168731.1 DUF2911 domain-containing protein [Flavobacteriaceae bacterium]MDC3285576.1 DUF2911 domain-containing protein [Flavobacteriaceae bacterium]
MKKIFITKTTLIALIISISLLSSCDNVSSSIEIEKKPTTKLKITTPQPSPKATVEQRVGLTDISIEYSRPGVRGRTIFGDLVPFGKTWRTGANSNTKVTFSSDVSIDGQTLNAGSYGLYTVPNENSWEVMFYSESDNSGVPRDWDDTKVVAKTSVEVYSMPMNVETFTITFDDVSGTSATLGILWEKTYVGIKLEVPTDKLVSETIDAVMAASPEAGDYYNAAIYYRQQDLDIKKANEWMEKAMSLTEKPAFWQLRQQSLIYAKMGETEKAIAVAEKSLELSKAAGNEAYVKMNTQSLAEWKTE